MPANQAHLLDRIDDDEDDGNQPVRRRKQEAAATSSTTVVKKKVQLPPEEEEEEEEEERGPPEEIDINAAIDAQRAAYQPTPLEKFMAILKSLILRAMVVYFVMSFIRNNGSSTTSSSSKSTTTGGGGEASLNAFPNGTEFTMKIHISASSSLTDPSRRLLWHEPTLTYGDWMEGTGGFIFLEGEFTLTESMKNNGSIYLHVEITSLDEQDKYTINGVRLLNKWKRVKPKIKRNLLSSSGEGGEQEQETSPTKKEKEEQKEKPKILSHYHPNITINLVTDWTAWTFGAVPAPLNEYVRFLPAEKKYLPVLFFNDYWNLLKDYKVVDQGNRTLPITLTFQPLSLFKWQLYAAQAMRNQWGASSSFQALLSSGGGEDEYTDEEQDTLKEAMIDTNPILLALTFVVSVLHSIFEFLAFKNDIQFWNNRKSLEGLSVRSVFFNVFQALIVLLYVLDNETNFVIRISCFVGLAIEIWKINKVTDIQLHRPPTTPLNPLTWRLTLTDKSSYIESETKKFDRMAFRYLGMICFPLLFAYAAYSLIYNEHKGVYSFMLSIAYGFLLTFGFIMMTPQLFINYKLKSVAHLPWRMLTYKFLNTFIDDIFAFVIKMPMMYRIGCLRDDVIFFVYLYQRWCYRVDYKRVNEFGYCAEGDKGEVGEGQGDKGAVEKSVKTGSSLKKTE